MIKENFIELIENGFKKSWNLIALEEYVSKKSLTYKELAYECAKLHIVYNKCGIRKGDKIAVCGKNSINWAVAYLATMTYGAVVVPVLEDFNPNDIMHIFNHCDAKLAFVDESIISKLNFRNLPYMSGVVSMQSFKIVMSPVGSELKRHFHSKDSYAKYKYAGNFSKKDVKYHHRDNSEMGMICYTSGTTSLTKGVMLSLNNLAGNVMFGVNNFIIKLNTPLTTSLCMLPMAHTYINSFNFLIQIVVGAKITILGKIPSPAIVVEASKKVKPSLVFLVPLILEKMYAKKIAPLINKKIVKLLLKTPIIGDLIYKKIGKQLYKSFGGKAVDIIVGGAALNPEVESFLLKTKFPFLVGYGMTECAPLISYIYHKDFVARSVGKILPDTMEIKIIKDDPQSESGEIVVRGENVMIGYYKDEEATKETFTEDGWLKTGDLGRIDEHGNIFIVGRSKTMLLGPNGENIYPEAIESKLQNLPLVQDCIVISNAKHRLEAWVYPDMDIVKEMNLTKETLQQIMEDNRLTLNNSLARYEGVLSINLIDEEFAKTPKRTIKRYLAERQIEKQKQNS